MDEKKLIIILLGIIAILIVGLLILGPMANKEDCKLTISDKKIYAGDDLIVTLKDLNGTAISNETIHIKLTYSNGTSTEKDIKTNAKGKAKLKIDEIGNYTIDCMFYGNDKFKSISISENITVNKATTNLISKVQTSDFDSVSGLSSDGYSYYPEYGPAVDAAGTTQEYAIANNWHYIPQTIDGKNAGLYVPYDSTNGCYHT